MEVIYKHRHVLCNHIRTNRKSKRFFANRLFLEKIIQKRKIQFFAYRLKTYFVSSSLLSIRVKGWAAFDWMYKKQLGRRNLTDEQRTLLLGKMYEARKNSIGGDRGNQYTKVASHQNDDVPKSKCQTSRTAASIAAEMGVGQSTVERAGQFAKGYVVLMEIAPDAAELDRKQFCFQVLRFQTEIKFTFAPVRACYSANAGD